MVLYDVADLAKFDDYYTAKKCPYCGEVPEFVDSDAVYNVSYGMIYQCKPCNAYVGVHKGTDKALGRLANKPLREAKIAAHAAFDKLWKEGSMSRKDAYKYLSGRLSIPIQYTHIGYLSVATCKQVVLISEQKLSWMKLKTEKLINPDKYLENL